MENEIITLATVMARHTGRSEATISNKCVGHARLFSRLKAGDGCTLRTASAAINWFAENWPADLEWPRDISRPRKQKKEAA